MLESRIHTQNRLVTFVRVNIFFAVLAFVLLSTAKVLEIDSQNQSTLLWSAMLLLDIVRFGLLCIMVILYYQWVYRVHEELNAFSYAYPISPKSALSNHLIPVYNVYGIWKTYKVLADFSSFTETGVVYGKNLNSYILQSYFIGFISVIFVTTTELDPFSPVKMVMTLCVTIALYTRYLKIYALVAEILTNLDRADKR